MCCMLSATGKIKDVRVFLSVRELLVTVHLTGFFTHLSCYNLSYETRKTANRLFKAWDFIPHSTAYFT